jgi:ABC-2 type transport system permease protein
MSSDNQGSGARVSSLSQVRTVTKYAFLNYFRARRFYVMLGIVLLVSALLTFAAAYYRPAAFGFGNAISSNPALTFYSGFWGGFATIVVILSVAFFGGDAISGEFQNKTGYFLIPNPLRRSVVYVGKWLAALGASTLILAIFALIALANGTYFFGASIPYQFGESLIFAWIYLVSAMGLTFLFSSLFKSSSISILMTVILFLFAFDVIDTVASAVAGIEPWFSITYAGGIIANVLTVPYPLHSVSTTLGKHFTLTTFNASITEGLAIMAVYFVVSAAVGLWLFERKEFTS